MATETAGLPAALLSSSVSLASFERLNRSVLTSSVLRGTVHSLNNMLQAIVGHVELLGQKAHQPEAVEARVERVIGQTARASSLIQDLSWLSREGAEGYRVADVVEVLDRVLSLREYDMARNRVSCTVTLDRTGTGRVSVEPRGLAVSLLNLILNAEQAVAGQPDAAIEISAARQDEWTIISVADNGPGIPDGEREAVFEPFYSTGRTGATLGLGLTVARGILESHGGSVALTPGRGLNGRGERFEISVPAANRPSLADFRPGRAGA